MNKIYLELVDNKHYKFYELFLDDLTLKISYGRIGKAGKLVKLITTNNSQALNLFMKKFKSKIKKGYKESIKGLNPPKIKGIHPNQLAFDFNF